MTPEQIPDEVVEAAAKKLCTHAGYKSDDLRAGNYGAFHWMEYSKYIAGEYDSDPRMVPDGTMKNGDPAMFMWRNYLFDARAALAAGLAAWPDMHHEVIRGRSSYGTNINLILPLKEISDDT